MSTEPESPHKRVIADLLARAGSGIVNRYGTVHDTERVPIDIHPDVRQALAHLLYADERFRGVGYSEFIARAIEHADALSAIPEHPTTPQAEEESHE